MSRVLCLVSRVVCLVYHEIGNITHDTRDRSHDTRDTRYETPDTRHYEMWYTTHEIRDTRHPTRDTRHETRDTRHETRDTNHPTRDTNWWARDTRHPTPKITKTMFKHPPGWTDAPLIFNKSIRSTAKKYFLKIFENCKEFRVHCKTRFFNHPLIPPSPVDLAPFERISLVWLEKREVHLSTLNILICCRL